MIEADPVDWGEDFVRPTDRERYLSRMDLVARKLTRLDEEMRELRVEYWRWQALAYPDYECNHPDTHFCKHCMDQAMDRVEESIFRDEQDAGVAS